MKKENKKKPILRMVLVVLVLLILGGLGAGWYFNVGGVKVRLTASSSAEIPVQDTESDSNILIAYFTAGENSDVDVMSSASVTVVDGVAKGNVRALADMIQEQTGGVLYSIQTSVEYPGNGGKLVDYAQEEQNADVRPELTTQIENFDQYATVFIGYPTWWYTLPMIMYTLFDKYDFTGKTVIPFCTSSSSDIGDSGKLLAEEAGSGDWQEGRRFSAKTSESEVREWVESLDL
jgi:flavodoxin